MVGTLIFAIVLVVASCVSALVPAQSQSAEPTQPVCPTHCLCVPLYANTAEVSCEIPDDFETFCKQVITYSKSYNDLNLKMEGNFKGRKLLSLKCLPSLQKLDLSNLRGFDLTVIKDVDMKYLKLSNNAIQSLPSQLFVGHPRLETLDLSHNLLEKISVETLDSLTSLKELDLSFNQIRTAPMLSEMFSLERLNLEHNQLKDLTTDSLPTSGSLRMLNLRNNSISTFIFGVNSTVNNTLQNIESLDISQNFIECSCVLGDLFSMLPSIKNCFAHKEETVCSSPDSLKGQLLMNVNEEDLLCTVPKNVVTYPSSSHSLAIYHSITLECHSDGYPTPSNLWITPWGDKLYTGSALPLLSQLHNETIDVDELAPLRRYWDRYVYLESTLRLTKDQNLEISNFRGSFSGKYICISVNLAGKKSQGIDLTAYSKIKAVYLDSIFIGGYCASGFLIFGLIVGAIRNCVIRFRQHFHFAVPIFSKSPSEHKADDNTDAVSASDENDNCKQDEENPDPDNPEAGPSSPLHINTSLSDEDDAPHSPDKNGAGSPWGWRSPAFLGSLEEARGKLRYGVGRRMDHLRKNVQSIKESGTVYVHSFKESSTSAANRVKAGMVYGVETVKSQVQSFKELCGTGNMGGQTISMMSVETDVDTNEQRDIIRQITYV